MRTTTTNLEIEIGDQKIPVVLNFDGEFYAEWEGDRFDSTTFKGLRDKLVKVVRAHELKRCKIPAMMSDYGTSFEPVTLIGIHAGNGNLLYTDRNGTTHQTRSADTKFFPILTEEQRARVKELAAAEVAADRATKDYLASLRVNAETLVRDALKLPKVKK